MKAYQALLIAYIAALAINAQAQGVASSNTGNGNGNFNLGDNNGVSNGLGSIGDYNGNNNGNQNTGNLNGVANGVGNLGSYNGNGNGNLNFGSQNGGFNGFGNTGDNNGNNNGNSNFGSNNGNNNGQGNVGSGNGNNNGNFNGQGDPIFTDFAGRPFEFEGVPGHYYNILSEATHQITTKLKVGVMWDHNGTYMEGIGFHYREHKAIVELNPASPDTLTVSLDGRPLAISAGQNELDHVVESADVKAELTINWMLHRADYGESVELQTEAMKVLIWVTPAGTLDEGGVEQPSYLNFDTTLLAMPANNNLEGIVGETYARLLAGEKAVSDPEHPLYVPEDFKFHGKHDAEAYAMAGYFDEAHALSLFGKRAAPTNRRRRLSEVAPAGKMTFPLAAGGGRDNSLRRRSLGENTVARAAGRGLVKQPLSKASGHRRSLA